MSLVDSVRRAVLRDGQPLILRRIATATAPVELALVGVVRDYAPHELVGNISQGDRRVTITNHEIAAEAWPGPPRKGDQLDIDGAPATLQAVNTLRHRGTIARHNLVVRG